MSAPSASEQRVRVWDLPTRLFHWTLLVAVVTLVVTGNIGGNAIDIHARVGMGVLALLAFRWIWGLIGGRWSRFWVFVPSPARLIRYLRGRATAQDHPQAGHNPMGAFSVLAMLGILSAQALTGLVIDDEIAFSGPLVSLVSGGLVSASSSWHRGWGADLLLLLIGLHVLAIVFYRLVKRRRLVKAMVTGDEDLPTGTPAARDDALTRLLAAVVLAACGAGAWWIWQWGQSQSAGF
ncbi:cytochrome b/b6 domain-containing protein [Ideonella livida]|uniref:Cytochrome B n=1 Tax=Ideonella livida TaxID=2707176 RepID=A0A7C9TJR2_9BURK|nr:cytochrome b/b6 domain-containing protein [Ideonella livida]NDY92181.1 cytochrome B [Ideonella livida]